jgi:hypothetical protein
VFSPLLLAVVVFECCACCSRSHCPQALLTSDAHCTVACQLDPRQTQRLLMSQTQRLMPASRHIRYILHTAYTTWFICFRRRRRHLCWNFAPGIFAHRRYQSDPQVCRKLCSSVTRFGGSARGLFSASHTLAAEPGSGQASAAPLSSKLGANV